jgi:hypothetical protein
MLQHTLHNIRQEMEKEEANNIKYYTTFPSRYLIVAMVLVKIIVKHEAVQYEIVSPCLKQIA